MSSPPSANTRSATKKKQGGAGGNKQSRPPDTSQSSTMNDTGGDGVTTPIANDASASGGAGGNNNNGAGNSPRSNITNIENEQKATAETRQPTSLHSGDRRSSNQNASSGISPSAPHLLDDNRHNKNRKRAASVESNESTASVVTPFSPRTQAMFNVDASHILQQSATVQVLPDTTLASRRAQLPEVIIDVVEHDGRRVNIPRHAMWPAFDHFKEFTARTLGLTVFGDQLDLPLQFWIPKDYFKSHKLIVDIYRLEQRAAKNPNFRLSITMLVLLVQLWVQKDIDIRTFGGALVLPLLKLSATIRAKLFRLINDRRSVCVFDWDKE